MSSEGGTRRRFPRWVEWIIATACVGTSLFYLQAAYGGRHPAYTQVGVIFAVCMALCFLYSPMVKGKNSLRHFTFFLDALFAFLSVAIIWFLVYKRVSLPLGQQVPPPTNFDLVLGGILMLLILEGTRRVAGLTLVVLIIIMFLYTYFGDYLPRVLNAFSFPLSYIIRYVAIEQEGIYGVALTTVAGVLMPFMIFSALLQSGGAGKFFIDLPYALVGRFRGGPAKLSVIASSLFGTISGSATANVVSVGTFTIPLMKSAGYRAEVAGAIEALASTGGQLMPPVMGVAAFVMAELIGVSYWSIVVAAILPAVIYYVAVFVAVHLEAVKGGMSGVSKENLPNARKVLAKGWFLLLPLVILIVLLGVLRWTPELSAFYAIIALIVVSWLGKETRMLPSKIWDGLSRAVRDTVTIAVFCAAIGIMIGMVGLSGLGPQFSNFLIQLSRGQLLPLLVLSMIASLILGMGMSTTPVYLFLALLVGPALVKMGVPLLAAHLFLFYYGVISAFTPPVALACYAAAPIARADPMKIGWLATRMGMVAYFMPFFFVYNPALIMQGSPLQIIWAALTVTAGAFCIGVGVEGFYLTRTAMAERIFWVAVGILFMFPHVVTGVIALCLMAAGTLWQYWRKKRQIGTVSA